MSVRRVVPSGHTFSRHVMELAKMTAVPLYWLRLIVEARADMQWWAALLPSWNGTAPLLDPRRADDGQPAFHADGARSGMGCGPGGVAGP